MKLNKIKISIGDYFKYKGLDSTKNINDFYPQNQETYVNTPTGLAPIVSMVKKEKNRIIEIETENNIKCKVAEKHIFPQENKENVYAIDAKEVVTIDGVQKIIKKEFHSNDYVYDISIPSPHVYYSANGILHHNTAAKVFTAGGLLLKKENVLFITLEMPEMEIAKRIDASLLGTTINELSELDDEIITEKFKRIKDNIGRLVIKEYGAGTFNVIMLKALLNELDTKQDFKPDAIFVDYLGLMVSPRATSQSNSYEMLGKVAEDLHAIAKETYDSKGNKGIKMISSSQTNRASIGNVDSGTESISDSLKIAQTADVLIMLTTTEQMREDRQQIWKIIKNRYTGKMDTLLMETNFERMQYSPYDNTDGDMPIDIPTNALDTGMDFGSINF